MKTNNPANEIKAIAKRKGISYWQYMAKNYPGSVRAYIWPVKGEKVKKERAGILDGLNSRMRGRKIGRKMLAGMRNVVFGNGR